MAQTTIGFIGFGNMGSAIAHGILATPALHQRFRVGAYDLTENKRAQLENAGGVWWSDPGDLTAACDLIVIAVKPYQVAGLLKGIRQRLRGGSVVLSIAAGVPLGALRATLGGTCAAVQVMPNTPALIGDGVFGLCFDDPALSEGHKADIRTLFEALGTVFVLPEHKMNALSAVTGCGPAYVYDIMDAMMEAAVTLGFTRKEAEEMTAALFRGSARMVAETGLHPAVLHSQVTSPGGMTIVGTNHLARTGVRGSIIDAILAADARGKAMEKE